VQVENDPLQNGQSGSQPALIMLGCIESPHVFAQGVDEARYRSALGIVISGPTLQRDRA
jgi:hypothetical protein